MKSTIHAQKYRYPAYYHYSQLVIALIFIYVPYSILATLFSVDVTDFTAQAFLSREFVYLILLFILITSVFITLANWNQEFELSEKGMSFQVFFFWHVFVPWKEILTIKETWYRYAKSKVIVAERITPAHRIMGILYGLTFKPSFVINRALPQYEEACELIDHMIRMKHSSRKNPTS